MVYLEVNLNLSVEVPKIDWRVFLAGGLYPSLVLEAINDLKTKLVFDVRRNCQAIAWIGRIELQSRTES